MTKKRIIVVIEWIQCDNILGLKNRGISSVVAHSNPDVDATFLIPHPMFYFIIFLISFSYCVNMSLFNTISFSFPFPFFFFFFFFFSKQIETTWRFILLSKNNSTLITDHCDNSWAICCKRTTTTEQSQFHRFFLDKKRINAPHSTSAWNFHCLAKCLLDFMNGKFCCLASEILTVIEFRSK